MTTDARPITQRLKEDTQDLHTRAEKSPFQAAMVQGRLPREQYVEGLEQLYLVHVALDRALESARRRVPAVAKVVDPEQFKASHAAADLAFFSADLSSTSPVPATRTLIELIERTERENPIALIGLHYVLEGANNGNMFIARVVGKVYGLSEAGGLRALMPYGPAQPEKWRAFKANLESLELSESEKAAIVEAAKAMFLGITSIHDALWQAMSPQPVMRPEGVRV